MLNLKTLFAVGALLLLAAGCTTPQTADHCDARLSSPLRSAMSTVENKLFDGCGTYYEGYVADLIEIASENPSADNKKAFSDFLVRLSDRGMISQRQARGLYNRYFNVKFVSLSGDYSTGSQVCPDKEKVLLEMRQELLDKETGLIKVSNDPSSYYRADLLLQEAELVLEATCRANGADRDRRIL